MKGIKQLILAAGAATMVGGPASAACWSNSAVEAAYVRDFDTILMVATLRCRTHGVEMATDYNRFVREKRAVLVAANGRVARAVCGGQGHQGRARRLRPLFDFAGQYAWRRLRQDELRRL